MEYRDPKPIRIKTLKGEEKEFILHLMPAYDGREVAVCYTQGALPKVGEYKVNEAMSLLMMKYVGVKTGDKTQMLETRDLVENHVPDWETLARLEVEMMKYNTSFFQEGKVSGLLESFVQIATDKISSMLTDLSAQSSQASKQHSES